MKKANLLWIALISLLFGCSYRDLKTTEPSSGSLGQSGASLSFQQIQASILGPKCARCHGWVANYDTVKSLGQEIQARINSMSANFVMPPPNAAALSPEEKSALSSWIAAGSPLEGGVTQPTPPIPSQPNEPPSPPSPPTPPVPPGTPAPRLSFETVNRDVFQPKCARCHSGMMSSYERVVANLNLIEMRVRSTFDFEKMPPPRAPQLTNEELNLLLDWIQAGAPKDGPANPTDPNNPNDPTQPQPSPQPSPAPAPTDPSQPGQPPVNPCEDPDSKKGQDDHCDDFISTARKGLL